MACPTAWPNRPTAGTPDPCHLNADGRRGSLLGSAPLAARTAPRGEPGPCGELWDAATVTDNPMLRGRPDSAMKGAACAGTEASRLAG
jgi:hypothetical protein